MADLKSEGFRVKKSPSGMGFTFVDLYVTHMDYGACWLELKTLTSVKQKVPLTTLQRKDLLAELKHGGNAACLVGVRTDQNNRVENLYMLDLGEEYVDEEKKIATRHFGENWPARNIINKVVTGS